MPLRGKFSPTVNDRLFGDDPLWCLLFNEGISLKRVLYWLKCLVYSSIYMITLFADIIFLISSPIYNPAYFTSLGDSPDLLAFSNKKRKVCGVLLYHSQY